jgi:hypothetical protein
MAGKKGKGDRNDNRPNAKAWKKTPGAEKSVASLNPKYVGGYSAAKLKERAEKRTASEITN